LLAQLIKSESMEESVQKQNKTKPKRRSNKKSLNL